MKIKASTFYNRLQSIPDGSSESESKESLTEQVVYN